MSCPSVFVRCDSGFVQTVFNFSPISCRAHIGFTAVKNTDCLSLLRLFPPVISPLLIMERISKAFPMWYTYSAESSGHSTLSCNVGSARVNCSEVQEFIGRVWIHAVLKHFVRSSPFCLESYPSINCPLQSANELYLQFFNKVVKSYCSIVSVGN